MFNFHSLLVPASTGGFKYTSQLFLLLCKKANLMSKERIFHLFAIISNNRTHKFSLQQVGESLPISSKFSSSNPEVTNLPL